MTTTILMQSPARATVTEDPCFLAWVFLNRTSRTFEVQRITLAVYGIPEIRSEWVDVLNRPIAERLHAKLEAERDRYIAGLGHACALGRLP